MCVFFNIPLVPSLSRPARVLEGRTLVRSEKFANARQLTKQDLSALASASWNAADAGWYFLFIIIIIFFFFRSRTELYLSDKVNLVGNFTRAADASQGYSSRSGTVRQWKFYALRVWSGPGRDPVVTHFLVTSGH